MEKGGFRGWWGRRGDRGKENRTWESSFPQPHQGATSTSKGGAGPGDTRHPGWDGTLARSHTCARPGAGSREHGLPTQFLPQARSGAGWALMSCVPHTASSPGTAC